MSRWLGCNAGRQSRDSANLEIEKLVLALFDDLRQPLLRYVLSVRIHPDVADDIVQEAFLRLHEHLKRHRLAETTIRGWVWKVVHNLALKHLEAAKRENLTADLEREDTLQALADPAPNPEEQFHLDQEQTRLLRELEQLSERERQCLYLRAEGLTYREIGEILGISRSTVADVLRRAIDRMRSVIHE